MSPEQQIIINMYKSETEAWRHQESQRAIVTNVFVIVSAALIGLITYDNKANSIDLPAAVLIIILGLLGFAFSLKYYERYSRHIHRARRFRSELVLLTPDTPLDKWIKEANQTTRDDSVICRVFHDIHLYWFWLALHILISLLGFLIICMIIFS